MPTSLPVARSGAIGRGPSDRARPSMPRRATAGAVAPVRGRSDARSARRRQDSDEAVAVRLAKDHAQTTSSASPPTSSSTLVALVRSGGNRVRRLAACGTLGDDDSVAPSTPAAPGALTITMKHASAGLVPVGKLARSAIAKPRSTSSVATRSRGPTGTSSPTTPSYSADQGNGAGIERTSQDAAAAI